MGHTKNNSKTKELVKEKLKERRKKSKELLKEKRARLIIRNLPFKANEENLREYFEQFGEVQNVELLKKEDGKLVGCGFIQFKAVQKAAKARHHTNRKHFLGREIEVDFAKAKDKYEKEQKLALEMEIKVEVKEEPIDEEAIKVEEEQPEVVNVSDDEKKSTTESDDDKSTSDLSEVDSEIEELEEEDSVVEDKSVIKKPHVISNDVTEGKTIFIKNVPFSATNEDLKECMYQFGPIYYALICVDKLTEHSKGTAFVKFQYKEDAEKALQAGTELKLMGNILDCHPALGRNEIEQKKSDSNQLKSQPKDSRNLYLVKEGVILAGSKAAEGVSAADMAKRLQLEQYKTQVLRNLNMYISRDRLVVHNLPPTWDDKKFRTLLQKYGGPGAIIKEARIMRDMRNVNENGIGRSKEFGFVTFTTHQHALNALRSLNNNPNIFSIHKRPIVTFSIENKIMVKAKQKRLEKSKEKNPIISQVGGKSAAKKMKKQSKSNSSINTEDNVNDFAGVTAKPGIQKMRSRYKLTMQAKMHHENLKKQKHKLKNAKKSFKEKQLEFTKQPKQKINKKVDSDSFSKLVNAYKQKLTAPEVAVKKTKWYN